MGLEHDAQAVTDATSRPAEPLVTGIVLAGGRSRRFGSDKLATLLGGRTLFSLAIDAVAPVCSELVVVASRDGPLPRYEGDPPLPLTVLRDSSAYPGPAEALVTGVAAASRQLALVIGADMPDLVAGVLALMIEACTDPGVDAVVLDDGLRFQPLPCVVRTASVLAIRVAAPDEKRGSLAAILRSLRLRTIPQAIWRPLDPDGETLRDIDSPRDLGARAGAARHRPLA